MARTTATVSFQAIELKGSLLPGSLLEQVARLQAPLQKEADYGLAKGDRLRERIDAAWVRLKEIWEEYRDLRERATQSTAGLHASARLLREVLGWPDLQPCSGWQHGDAHFPITHRAFEGAVPVILRGISADQLDKGSSAFGQERRRRSPHSCLQECLNADDNANWGLLLTGDRLRLLHDNPSLVKPAYLAVDLELLVDGELFDEFAVLWLLLHASRFRHPQTGSCVLDTWKEQAQEAGERVLGQLRNGVQQALEALGNGLLQHPENEALRNQLASGALSGQELHRQLLRLVYRFLFLFTAEDRDLLFPRTLGQEDPRRRIYREGYSVGRLRELAIRRSASEGPYGDLWQTQKLVFLQLRQSSSPLGLPGLGGLFAEPQCQALEPCELANRYLLRAIRAIGWFQAGDTLTRVNYRDLNTEELGSVYEGLLELHPQLERAGGSWQLSYGGGAGSDRKTTGSYYTPDQLVQLLIVSALLPVIADRLAKASTPEEKEQALLAIRVLDPACGSGHFLLAAARRLALELARIRAGDEEPSEELRQECLREVVAHCIYGVDKNPMAVELCKVALWIEAVDPGKPLSFLDAHIQCGDSLVGVFDPKVLEQGIPDEAYKPLTGDDKPTCTSLKKENASFRKAGQKGTLQGTLNLQSSPPISHSQQRLQEIEAMPETTLAEGAAKQAAYEAWEQERSTDPQTLAADLYTAAFFLPKTQDSRGKVPTTEHLLHLQSGQEIPGDLELAVEQAARDFRFFHWHLRFGEVMEKGGFDCVLGNPPWESLSPDRREFFRTYVTNIRSMSPSEQDCAIQELLLKPTINREWEVHQIQLLALANFLKQSGRFVLFAPGNLGKGDFNVYRMFVELAVYLTKQGGIASQILPSGFYGGANASAIRKHVLDKCQLTQIIGLENKGQVFFPDVHPQTWFCLYSAKVGGRTNHFDLTFGVDSFEAAKDIHRHTQKINADLIRKSSPETYSIPDLRTKTDLTIANKMQSSFPSFGEDKTDPPFRTYQREVDMGNDKLLFCANPKGTPVYEGRMISHFDHRAKTYEGGHGNSSKWASRLHGDLAKAISPQWYIMPDDIPPKLALRSRRYRIGFGDVVNARNERSFVAILVPPGVICGHTVPTITFDPHPDFDWLYLPWLAVANSFVMDWLTRSRLSTLHLSYTVMDALPFPRPSIEDKWVREASNIVLRLICTAPEMTDFWNQMAGHGFCSQAEPGSIPASALVTESDREVARASLDALVAHEVYGLTRPELSHILESFTVVKKRDLAKYDEFRTKRLVLEAWDRLLGGD